MRKEEICLSSSFVRAEAVMRGRFLLCVIKDFVFFLNQKSYFYFNNFYFIFHDKMMKQKNSFKEKQKTMCCNFYS